MAELYVSCVTKKKFSYAMFDTMTKAKADLNDDGHFKSELVERVSPPAGMTMNQGDIAKVEIKVDAKAVRKAGNAMAKSGRAVPGRKLTVKHVKVDGSVDKNRIDVDERRNDPNKINIFVENTGDSVIITGTDSNCPGSCWHILSFDVRKRAGKDKVTLHLASGVHDDAWDVDDHGKMKVNS